MGIIIGFVPAHAFRNLFAGKLVLEPCIPAFPISPSPRESQEVKPEKRPPEDVSADFALCSVVASIHLGPVLSMVM